MALQSPRAVLVNPVLPTAPRSSPSRRPIRALTLTTLFPNACRPRHGIFVANRVARMRDTGRVDPHVVAAVPWFPGVYRDAVPRTEAVLGMPVRHPRYVHLPRIGMRVQPNLLAIALLREVRRMQADGARFDIVDAHYFYPDGIAAAHVARALGLPLAISARGSDINLIGEMPFAREHILLAAARADALIAVSGALARKMAEMGMKRERIHVLRNGVDAELFRPEPMPAARARLALDPVGRIVLGAGHLVHEKGFDLLIRSMANLPDTRLLLVGDGPLGNALRGLAADVAPGRVDFRPNMPQSELRFAYSACDVLALPSLREGWPNVVLEAIACGTPVVASRVGGLPEILGDHGPGTLVDERDPHMWSRALADILNTGHDRATVRNHALRFGWNEVVSQQCELYERIVADSDRRVLRSSA